MQYFLTLQQLNDIPIKHLFVEYKFWIERRHPFPTVELELATIARMGGYFRRVLDPKPQDIVARIAHVIDVFDVRTAYPLVLYLMEAGLSESDYEAMWDVIESYIVRRAYAGLTTKNYNRVFLNAIRSLAQNGATKESLANYFAGLNGESTSWPTDEQFSQAWHRNHAYQLLNNPKIVHILRRLNTTYLSPKTEDIEIKSPMTIEHILPQSWLLSWPLLDGSKGLNGTELWTAPPEDSRAEQTRKRNAILQTIGNLTLVTQPLNSSVSNSSWATKKPELIKSLLPINHALHGCSEWNEHAILTRANDLLTRALAVWPRPTEVMPG